MTNDLQIFNSPEFGSVRILEVNGEPFFVGKDVADGLGYQNGSRDINRHVDEDDRHKAMIFDGNQDKETILINESGFYSLVLSSKMPKAKKYKHWVTSEVLPSIRKHGAYITPQTMEDILLNPDTMIELLKEIKAEREKSKQLEITVTAQQQQLEEDKPYTEFAKYVTESSDAISIGEFAKIVQNEKINIGRNRLFSWLRCNKYLGNDNTPYQSYIDKQYFKVIEAIRNTAYGRKIFAKTLITGKGQIVLMEKLRKEFGI